MTKRRVEITASAALGGDTTVPEKVFICSIPHAVTLCEDSFNSGTHFGQIEYAKCEIKINANMPEVMQRQTLCHEMLHGMLALLGYDDLTQDEIFVRSLSMAINQSFRIRETDDG